MGQASVRLQAASLIFLSASAGTGTHTRTFLFPSELPLTESILATASRMFRTSSEGVFCFDLKMKFIAEDVVMIMEGGGEENCDDAE